MGDPFQIVREIGRGATGAVYEVRVPGRAEPMAAKVLEAHTDQSRQRFEREFAVMARFRHPNVATAHQFGVTSSGAPYLLLDLIQGGTLEDVFEREGPLVEERARDLLTPVARGLAHAHGLGTTHRDLKPANVLITRTGTPILSDFGVAQSLELERLTLTGAVVGTPAYMAPEQQRAGAPVGPASDVYALGVILYEALTGELPYANTNPRAKAPELSLAMSRIVQRCLQEDPARRYANAGELVRALEVVDGKALARPWLAAGVLSLLLIPFLVAGVVWSFAKPSPDAQASPVGTFGSPASTGTPLASPTTVVERPWRLELQPGDRQRGRFRRVMTSGLGAQALAWGVEHEVLQRNEQTLRIKATIVAGHFSLGEGNVLFDSERPELTQSGYEGMSVLLNKSYVFVQDHRTGRVLSVGGGDALIVLLKEQGFPAMNWLSNTSLRRFFTALFGVLPGEALPPGQGWESPAAPKGIKVKCRVLQRAPDELVLEGDHKWISAGVERSYRAKVRWRSGTFASSEVEYLDSDDDVGRSTNVWTWEQSPQPR